MQKAKKTPLSARRLGAFPAPKSVIRTTERQPKPLRLQGQSRYHGYHGFQLKWMTTTWSLRTFLKCAFHAFSRSAIHFSGWMWAVHGSPAVPSGLLVVLYLLVKAPLPITGHGSHYISLAAGPPFGDTDTWWSTYGSSLQIPQKNPNLEILSWQKTSAWSIQK